MDKLNEAIKSKRFWAIVITGAITAANNYLKILDEQTMLGLVAIIMSAVVGDSMRPIGTKADPK